ncbi:BQ5605_C025g10060 [Microbotryum silenes-dioicae]|uniref:BQ5605_C025g10060 protein n=1 Tax=Microbotryum silenes-dioicae TaxID=796604 RepID=A0A2X0NF90_9BASI|nr:BQ5605_C025g10060 [Microbotryum silenes-dioicae]
MPHYPVAAVARSTNQQLTGAAAIQAGLSEVCSNRLIVSGLSATSATSAKGTLDKYLLHNFWRTPFEATQVQDLVGPCKPRQH